MSNAECLNEGRLEVVIDHVHPSKFRDSLIAIEQPFCRPDTFVFAQFVPFIFNIDIAREPGVVQNNLHHAIVINLGLGTLAVELVSLAADAPRIWHELADGVVAIRAGVEIAKVWQGTEI